MGKNGTIYGDCVCVGVCQPEGSFLRAWLCVCVRASLDKKRTWTEVADSILNIIIDVTQ